MATYSNQHWLLSHIRNSFISTDDTGICETVMVSDDLPHNFLRKFQQASATAPPKHNGPSNRAGHRSLDRPLTEADFICYPGLDESDDDDDLSAQSFDIQMYPEVGAHRFRSNTAQKLEKMDIARRRAARTKCIHYDDELVPPESSDFFERKVLKPLATVNEKGEATGPAVTEVKSRLSLQLANTPKQAQNKFMEFARFDGTSQTGMATKRLNVFLNMLPEKERNYPIKICVIASAKILEVIGLICYTATVQFPEVPLKSIRHYALYMTEDNDDLDDFPPLDNREPCSKFGFSHLTLAERRPLAPVTRIDYLVGNNTGIAPTKSMTSEDENSRLTVSLLDNSDPKSGSPEEGHPNDISENNDILEAPLYRTFQLHIIDKRFFKTEVTLGIAGDRIEIDQHKNAKFWTKQKAVTYPIDSIAFCEIVERRTSKSVVRIWLKSSSSPAPVSSATSAASHSGPAPETKSVTIVTPSGTAHSPASPSHYSSPFAFFMGSVGGNNREHQHHHQIRFKHYDFEAETQKAEQIQRKMDCILKVRSSEVRREFLLLRERKLEKSQAKKSLKL